MAERGWTDDWWGAKQRQTVVNAATTASVMHRRMWRWSTHEKMKPSACQERAGVFTPRCTDERPSTSVMETDLRAKQLQENLCEMAMHCTGSHE